MTDPDPTELNASERDLLVALGACLQDPTPPSKSEVRLVTAEGSARFHRDGTGAFYRTLESLKEECLVIEGDHPSDSRTERLGLTSDGEKVLALLAERSVEAADARIRNDVGEQ